ncbi:MAG: response regulator [Spirochaetes bacterium]|nr:response regulator [Spirochaetota bacterium]
MRNSKILVVDDDKIVLESCKRILEDEGYKVILVESAEGAIDLLEMEYVDLLIMDMKMPTHDGMYLFEQIKRKWPLDIWPELPVIVMSGYPTPKTIKDGLNRGAADFIPKPFTPDELISSVNKALKRRKEDGPRKSDRSPGTGD